MENEILMAAIRNRNLKLIKYYLEGETEVTVRAEEFKEAVRLDARDIVDYFIQKGVLVNVTPDERSECYIICAAKGYLEMAEKLFVAFDDRSLNHLTKSGERALPVAIEGGILKMVTFFCQKRAALVKLVGEKAAPLHIAITVPATAQKNQIFEYVVEEMIKREMSLEVEDDEGNTPLMKAVSISDFGYVKHLRERGAALNVINRYGKNALQEAVLKVSSPTGPAVDIVNFLHKEMIEEGAEVNLAQLVHSVYKENHDDMDGL
ncbi:MAG: hypothetical protein PHD51_01025 [Patescibacteria group bacterium]|nr:hypothetical protein [Patescibacteria group bacterium]MDD5490555.1 hypothetical protein [Patescibacteria group bacterium]